jgi:hypothetical protein
MEDEAVPMAAHICPNEIGRKCWVRNEKKVEDTLIEAPVRASGGTAQHRPEMADVEEEAILARRIPKFPTVRGSKPEVKWGA